MLDGTYHLAGVGVLIVVPGYHLNLGRVLIDRKNHRLGRVEQGTIGHADHVAGYDLVGVVAEGLVGSGLHRCVNGFLGGLSLYNSGQDRRRTGRGGNTLSRADQLSV